MTEFEFYQLDVFTDEKFCGNPLAVFPDARGISGEQMQKIANEMNLSETVFVLPSEKALRRLRIFTPQQELPLAGHPVVGTWNLLARLGITPQKENGTIEIEQELNLGVLPVEIEFSGGEPSKVTMTQSEFRAGEILSDRAQIEKLAAALGLEMQDINNSERLPIRAVSTGIFSVAVPLRSLEALSRCRINAKILSEIYTAFDAVGTYVFAFETRDAGSKIHTRFFAPEDGIPEDPATGSAAGALSGYLLHHGAVEESEFILEQGDFMNRPSRIHAAVFGKREAVEKVKIGGSSVVIAKGNLFLN